MNLDEAFRVALETLAENRKTTIESVVERFRSPEFSNRVESGRKLRAALQKQPINKDELGEACKKCWVLDKGAGYGRWRDFLKSAKAEQIIAKLIADDSPTLAKRINDFIEAAMAAGYVPGGQSDPAQFASVMLAALHPDQYVDYRGKRWEDFMGRIAADRVTDLDTDSYGEAIIAASRFAVEIAETPTFKRYFGEKDAVQQVAAMAFLLKDDKSGITDKAGENSENESMKTKLHDNAKAYPLNLIFYGPPGTGKSYKALRYAVEIVDGTEPDEGGFRNRYDELVDEGRIGFVTFHQSYSYEDFVEGIRPVLDENGAADGQKTPGRDASTARYECRRGIFRQMCDLAAGKKDQKFVLIIDEINRGNISKILGELITLLEEDKRIGGKNTITVKLPYSQQTFGVPGNIYVIGTMNTADKSIALVDVALRRRFAFRAFRTDLEVCKGLNDEMKRVLTTLNQRLMLRKDRDHQIGHSYFMDVSDKDAFNRVFAESVVPLLQEYFYNDWEGLRFVLGEDKLKSGTFVRSIAASESKWARTKWQWYADAGEQEPDFLGVLTKNYKADNSKPDNQPDAES